MTRCAPIEHLDPAYLRARLRYEEETGKLFWRHYEGMPNNWLAYWPGREAFTAKDAYGYRQGCVDGRKLKGHRVVWALHHGAWPEEEIDHLDHDRSNNKIGNLRVVSKLDNCRNLALNRKSTSGVAGVSYRPRVGRWHAYITLNRRNHHLGLFDAFEDAVAARKRAEVAHGFHPNHGAAS